MTSPAHELPQSREDVLSREPGGCDEIGPEERACRERGADRDGHVPLRGRVGSGGPSSGASSRKYTATRSRPAPTQTTSPDAHSTSRSAGRNDGTRRGSTSLSQSVAGKQGPAAGRAPRATPGAARRRARRGGTARTPPARPARPRDAARRAWLAGCDAARRDRTTRVLSLRGEAHRERAVLALQRRELGSTLASSSRNRVATSAVVNGPCVLA